MSHSSGDPVMPLRQALFRMVSVGVVDEPVNQLYDIISTGALVLNLVVSIMATFDSLASRYGAILTVIESVTVFFFFIDYILRLATAKYLYPAQSEGRAVRSYITSFAGVIDVLSFLPYYLPVFFPAGAVAFRMFRVVRILRLFRINAYYDSLNVITEVIAGKKQQLLSSVFIILVLMLGASLCMYSLEHQAQPEVFENAFSGIWWAVSTLLTVGYGDIYPVTVLGKAFGILIAFLGVGMVAIPTGIISAGFVEQYSRLKQIGENGMAEDIRFIRIRLSPKDSWCGKEIRHLSLPSGILIAAIQRSGQVVIPKGNTTLLSGDHLILGAEAVGKENPLSLREVILGEHHPWSKSAIRDLDISRKSLVVSVRRNDQLLSPSQDLVLRQGDHVLVCSRSRQRDMDWIEV